MLRKISITLALIAFVICIGLYKEHLGFDKGYTIADESCERVYNDINFSGGVTRTYEHFAYRYQVLVWGFLIFLFAKLLEAKSICKFLGTNIIGFVFSFVSFCLLFYQFWWLYIEKSNRLQESFLFGHFDDLLRDSVYFDWVCFFIAIILLLLQFIILLKPFYKKYIAGQKPLSSNVNSSQKNDRI